MPEGGEKTENATQKKRQDERKKGNIFSSKDVSTIVSLVVGFYIVRFFIAGFITRGGEYYRQQIGRIGSITELGPTETMLLFREIAVFLILTVIPAIIIIGIVDILIAGAQTRFLWSNEVIRFKFERINPISGMKKFFSLRALVELFKSLIKIIVLIYLLYGRVMQTIEMLPVMLNWDLWQAAAFAGQEIMDLIILVAIAFGIIAALDYLYQRWEYEKSIKMTKQEVKDEYKQMEGNPEIKGKRREKQREYAMQRMMQAVKEADVVVRNPTHFAVALRYGAEDAAPVVLAKGQDNIALRIVEEADRQLVPTVENKPLARSLYDLAEIDEMIPPELFQPVAELLAWLYSQKQLDLAHMRPQGE